MTVVFQSVNLECLWVFSVFKIWSGAVYQLTVNKYWAEQK